MMSLHKASAVVFFTATLCITLSTVAFSLDREVYDTPGVQLVGKTIQGKVVQVNERDPNMQRWDVSVQNGDTGEVVALHIDKTTTRKDSQLDPAVGANVIVKYDEKSRHAISFLVDTPTSH